jgi:cold-inducible RNA-binding protein
MKLYAGNLPPTFSDKDLEDLFASCGTVVSARVVVDRESGRSRGFGFVEMSSAEEGKKCITDLNKKAVGKGQIVVNEAQEKRKFQPREGGGRDFRESRESRGPSRRNFR